MDIRYFDSIKVIPPQKRIYSRLGYKWGKTQLTSRGENLLKECIEKGVSLVEIKGVAVRKLVQVSGKDIIQVSDKVRFKSEALFKFLSGCKELLIMGATAGDEIMNLIKDLTDNKELSKAIIFDAFASETVDEALSWIMDFFNHELRRENKRVTTRRFSAGYRDLSLENQKTIYDILNMKKLGVEITESFLLKPEKSVTAIAGIKEIESSS